MYEYCITTLMNAETTLQKIIRAYSGSQAAVKAWKKVAKALGLSQNDILAIQGAETETVTVEMVEAMLRKWKENGGRSANKDSLAVCLQNLKLTEAAGQSIHSSISGHFYSASSSPLLLRSAPDYIKHGYYIGVSRRSAHATVSKGLAQDPYVAARAGVEPTSLRLKVIASANAPPRPTNRPTIVVIIYIAHQ